MTAALSNWSGIGPGSSDAELALNDVQKARQYAESFASFFTEFKVNSPSLLVLRDLGFCYATCNSGSLLTLHSLLTKGVPPQANHASGMQKAPMSGTSGTGAEPRAKKASSSGGEWKVCFDRRND